MSLKLLESALLNIKAIILVNPMPFTFQQWQAALQKIESRITLNELQKIKQIESSDNDGSKIFAAYFPYYIAQQETVVPKSIKFNSILCDKIASQVTDYDYRRIIGASSIPIVCIVGEKDPFYESMNNDCHAKIISMPNVGHYSFIEDTQSFKGAVKQVEDILCRMI